MEMEEDLIKPMERKDNFSENTDKFAHFLGLLKARSGVGAAQFKRKAKSKNSKEISYQGRIPDWARPVAGEVLFSDEEEVRLPESYLFPYSPVPLPSIQNTLQKFVNI
jgi:hypothetical protein